MQKVAIVGNIASGKSTVEQFLLKKGYPVLDTDVVCHNLLNRLDEIKEEFSEFDVFCDGKISREKLGKLVFSQPEQKKKLESILYPYVQVDIARFFTINKDYKYVFVSIPQLFEAQMEDLFDKILFVYTDDKLRLERLIKRNGYSKEYAQVRLDSQMSQDEKVKLADWVVYNNTAIKDLEKSISKLIV